MKETLGVHEACPGKPGRHAPKEGGKKAGQSLGELQLMIMLALL